MLEQNTFICAKYAPIATAGHSPHFRAGVVELVPVQHGSQSFW